MVANKPPAEGYLYCMARTTTSKLKGKPKPADTLPGMELGRPTTTPPISRAASRIARARADVRQVLDGLASPQDLPPAANKALVQASAGQLGTIPPKTLSGIGYRQAIADERARIASLPGYRLEDSAGYYHRISKAQEHDDPSTGIQARRRLDAILGLDAPQESIVGDGTSPVERQSIAELLEYLRQSRVSPQAMLADLKDITDQCQVTDNTTSEGPK